MQNRSLIAVTFEVLAKVIEVRLRHLANVDSPSLIVLAGTAKETSPEASKAEVPMSMRAASGEMSSEARLVHPQKASCPIDTGFLSTIVTRVVQRMKARVPILTACVSGATL